MAQPDPFVVSILGPPPPGLDLAESTQARNLVITILFFSLAALFVGARFSARYISNVQLQADDYVLLIAFALTITTVAFSIISGLGGAGTHVWAVTRETIQLGLKYGYAYAFVWSVSVSVTKFSIILFYRRTFLVQDWKFRAWLHFLSIITVGFLLSIIIANFTLCEPLSYYWRQFEPGAQGRCNDAGLFLLVTGVLNAVIDVILLATPIPLVLKLKMSPKKKIGVCGILLSGSVVCVASFIRIGYLVSYWKTIDKPWVAGDVSAWSSIESSFGLISASLPLLRPLYNRFRDRYSKGTWGGARTTNNASREKTSGNSRNSIPTWKMTHDSTKQNNTSWQSTGVPSSRDDETLLIDITASRSAPGEDIGSDRIIVHSEVKQSYGRITDGR